jgi:hypothetical protein
VHGNPANVEAVVRELVQQTFGGAPVEPVGPVVGEVLEFAGADAVVVVVVV